MSRLGAMAARFGGALERMAPHARGRLFRKYAIPLVALVGGALTVNSAIEAYYSYQENRLALVALQREKAQGAAAIIEQFVKEIEGQLGWTTHASIVQGAAGAEQRRFEFLRLLRQAPAITEVAWIDPQGREQIRVSRLAMDVIGSGADFSQDRKFTEAKANKRFVSPVYFRKESEPYLTLALAGTSRGSGVAVAEVNLKFIWDVVSRIKVGGAGAAYVVDERGFLIAHPDIGLVLRKTDLSALDHVATALERLKEPLTGNVPPVAQDRTGRDVLAASATIPALRWLVFVEQPLAEAYRPIYESLWRSGLVLAAGLTIAALAGLWLAKRMVVPIRALADGAARIGGGDLDHRIVLSTGDEVQALADGFNEMSGRLKESYATLEHKVDLRTRELSEALEYQTATSEVLSVISRSPSQVQPVLDTIVAIGARLCEAEFSILFSVVGNECRVAAGNNVNAEYSRWLADHPVPLGSGSTTGRAALERRTIHVPDVLEEPAGKDRLESRRRGGQRTCLSVPLLREAAPLGVITLMRSEVRAFTERQVALVETFADQAVIAIENARLFDEVQARTAELTEALKQQTATADVLKVISRSTFDLPKVLDTLLDSAAQLCEADIGTIRRRDGGHYLLAATYGCTPEWRADFERYPMTPDRGSVFGRTIIESHTVHIPDVLADPEFTRHEAQKLMGFRAALGVPLMREGKNVGILTLFRSEPRSFTQQQIELVETFADQAVIAIENVRLFEEVQARTRELTQSLEYQTATSEVLGVISRSPNELQPVLDAIVVTAGRLCEADYAHCRLERDGLYHVMAFHSLDPDEVRDIPAKPVAADRTSLTGRAVSERRTIHVPDVLADPEDTYAVSVGVPARTMLGVPLMRDGVAIGVIGLFRRAVRPFTQRQIDLVTIFANQAVIAINNVRLFEEVQARTKEVTESLEYQTATSEVLSVISRSPDRLQPVLDAITETASRLCDSEFAAFFNVVGDRCHIAAANNADPAFIQYLKGHPVPVEPGSAVGRAAHARKTLHVEDILTLPGYTRSESQKVGGQRTVLSVPLLREADAIGVIALMRSRVKPFTDRQIKLVETFANQAVIAINNVGLFEEVQARTAEVTEALEYQTATSDMLNVISRSPSQIQPVLDAIVETASRLCDAYDAIVLLREGEWLKIAAHLGPIPTDFVRWPIGRGWTAGRAVVDRKPVHVHDLLAADDEFPEGHAIAVRLGQRTILSTPLLRENEAIGVLVIRRTEVRPFSEKQIDLLQTFADQAVIAIENARLFEEVQARTAELQESLKYQTAISEVLGVISRSPTDVQPVFDTIARSALHLCGGTFSSVLRFDGRFIHFAAAHGMTSEGFEALRSTYPLPPGRAGATTRVIETGALTEIPDVDADPHFEHRHIAGAQNFKSLASVPMLKDGRPIGTITVGQAKTGRFPERQIALLRTFADQAVIAIENARLFEEVQARTAELSRSVSELRALGEVGQAVSSSLDLETVLNNILQHACEMSSAGGGAIYALDENNCKFVLEAGYNMSPALIAAVREHQIRRGDTAVGECTDRREAVQVPDIEAAADHPLVNVLREAGFKALLAVPLLHQERAIGALLVRRKSAGSFSPDIVTLLQTFASQSALAIYNARLFKEIEEKSRQLEIASQHKSQFLANMSHELRTPLNAILGYTELIQDGVYGEPSEKTKGVLDRVQANGKHLLGLINDVLDLSKIEAGHLTLRMDDYSMSSVVQTVVAATESLAAEKKLPIKVEMAATLPVGRGDERRIAQVLLNLVGNAIKFTDEGEVRIAGAISNGRFSVEVADTGPGIPTSEHERIFEEFHQVDSSNTKKKGGSGLGLAISKRIVEMHGGRIWVDSDIGHGSTFHVELPIRAEQRTGVA